MKQGFESGLTGDAELGTSESSDSSDGILHFHRRGQRS
jgi:hypothetical protein